MIAFRNINDERTITWIQGCVMYEVWGNSIEWSDIGYCGKYFVYYHHHNTHYYAFHFQQDMGGYC